MARKKIREYDGKRLFAEHMKRLSGLQFQLFLALVSSDSQDFQKLAAQNPWLKDRKLVAKPDVLFGKRGKNNLVLLNATLPQVEEFVKERVGKDTEVGGLKGTLSHFLIEPFVPHKEEYYLSLVSNREDITIYFSPSGGVDIEENWGTVKEIVVPSGTSIDSVDLGAFSAAIPDESRREKILDFIRATFKVFEDLDFVSLELNPFVFDETDNIVPLDFVAEVDSTAHFKNTKKWGELDFPQPFGRILTPEEQFVLDMDEKTGASLKLTVLNPQGRIWSLVAGGGASVIFADTVADLGFGPELGNYGEYSGGPNEEETYHYARTVLGLATRNPDGRNRALLIGGGIANFTDVAKTFKGIIHALKEYKDKIKEAKMKIFVRRAGPNYQTGLKLMRELGKELSIPIEVFGPEVTMTSIVPHAVEYIKSG